MKIGTLKLHPEEKRLLWHLRTRGPTPRIALAAVLQASNASLTKISQNLLNLGLIEELAPTDAKARGRPMVPLSISAGGGCAVGATVHKGVLEIALVDYAGGVISLTSEAVGAPDPTDFARILDRRINELSVQHRLLGTRFLGVGIALPGPSLSRDRDLWQVVHELPGWRNVPLKPIFDDVLGFPAMLENDANCAALAEYYLGGTIRRSFSAVVVLLGYGIGAGIIEDGRLAWGQVGAAGEIGALYPADRPRPTTLDLLSTLQAAGCKIESVGHFDEITRGYEDAIESWLHRTAKLLEPTVSSAVAWFDPGEVILSSPLPRSLLVRLADKLNHGDVRWGLHRPRFDVQASELGGSAIALGAALLPIHASTERGR